MQHGPRPLDGIRVLELASIVAGPFCGGLMAEFGADVIKTEIPGRGDDIRRMGPREDDVGYWWALENRGKKVFTLDLHQPQGQEIVKRLVAQVDVVLENFRPGVLERWHLGWEDLSRINPRLVMAGVPLKRNRWSEAASRTRSFIISGVMTAVAPQLSICRANCLT